MPGVKLNARDLIVEVADPEVADTWVEVDGITSATINKAENEETADTTTYGSDGEYEHEIMQRGGSLSLEGFYYDDDGEQDDGQGVCSEMATRKAEESLGEVRMRYPSWTDWVVWTCTFSEGEIGGANNDKASWNMTIGRSGAARAETVETAV